MAIDRKLQYSKLQQVQVNTMRRITGKKAKKTKKSYITNALVQHIS